MIKIESRFDVRLKDRDLLRKYMDYRDYTVRSLAEKVGCPRATIGHLVGPDPKRKNCKPELAKKIAKALDAPRDFLFDEKVSYVQRETSRLAA